MNIIKNRDKKCNELKKTFKFIAFDKLFGKNERIYFRC